mgnify:CR=1 FL=1
MLNDRGAAIIKIIGDLNHEHKRNRGGISRMIAITMSGCVYANNKNWDDMTPEEQEEVRQNFEEERKELEEDFPSDSVEGKFTSYIPTKKDIVVERF